MNIFASEKELIDALDRHDELVRKCVGGCLPFEEFCREYNDFYAYYALDGHESDEDERDLLEKHAVRIEPHRMIAMNILGRLCSDEDAQKDAYLAAGRFGSAEAVRRLKMIVLPT